MYKFLFKHYPIHFLGLVSSVVLVSLLNLVQVYLLQKLFDQIILVELILIYIVFNLLANLGLHVLTQTVKAKVSMSFTKGRLSDQIQASVSQFMNKDMGQFVNEFTSELSIAIDQYLTTSILIIRYGVSFFISAIYIGMMNGIILTILLGSGLALLMLNQMSSTLLVHAQKKVVHTQQDKLTSLQHFFQGFRTLYHYHYLRSGYDRVVEKSQKNAFAQAKLQFLLRLFGVLSDNYMQAILFIFTGLGVVLVGQGQMSLGQLIACVQLSNQIVMPITEIVDLRNQLNASKEVTQSFLLDEKALPSFDKRPEATCLQVDIDRFGYGQEILLRDIHLCFQKGKSYLLLGKSGSGKSTFLKLLLNEIKSGTNYSGQISPVFDEGIDLGLSLVENICMNEPFDQARFNWSLEMVELETQQRIESAGQKQRVQIARALYHRRPWLVMDEPISHLDEALATRIMDRILALDVGVIMVSHQQVPLCFDHVYHLDQGRWIEKKT